MDKYNIKIKYIEFTIYKKDYIWGDGEHHSTQYMLELVSNCDLSGKTVLDIGTGTGILSVLCGKLGAKEILAIDIYDDILECARHNFTVNNVDVKTLKNDLTKGLDYKADVVLANLYYKVQFENLLNVGNNIKDGGLFILTWKNSYKMENYIEGFEVIEHIPGEDYDGYILKKIKGI